VDATLYRSLVGNLLYLTTRRPDIIFAASLLSWFIHSLSHFHFAAAKLVFRYIKGTISNGIRYCGKSIVKFLDFCDSDWGGCIYDMKSTSGYASELFTWIMCVFMVLKEATISCSIFSRRRICLNSNNNSNISSYLVEKNA
jgi:hypothetical protein